VDYKAGLEQRASRLVGRRVTRVRYDLMIHRMGDEFGPDVDADIDSLLLDLDGEEPAYLTWSNESGFSYGIMIAFDQHWSNLADNERPEGWITIDVSATSRWREVLDEAIVEAKIIWHTVFSEELPHSALAWKADELHLDHTQAQPASISSVPQELALRFTSGRWLVVSAARYLGEGKGFYAWMDELLVVHDDAFMQQHGMGPYAAPALEAPP
jgi:hypothetical protein